MRANIHDEPTDKLNRKMPYTQNFAIEKMNLKMAYIEKALCWIAFPFVHEKSYYSQILSNCIHNQRSYSTSLHPTLPNTAPTPQLHQSAYHYHFLIKAP